MKAENVKAAFVYANITFVIVAGFYVLYQLATSEDIPIEAQRSIGAASIFSGFVGMAIQFLTGQATAERATSAATSNFTTGLAAPVPPTTTITTSEGPPATSTTVTTGPVAGPPAVADVTGPDPEHAAALANLDALAAEEG